MPKKMTPDFAFLSQLFSEPLAVRPCALEHLFQEMRSFDPEQRADDKVGAQHSYLGSLYPQVEVVGNVGIVKLHGFMSRHTTPIQQFFGMADTALFQEQLRNCRDDKDIEIVVTDIRTPGGFVYGLAESTATMREVSESGKPVIAWVDKLAASAGYYAASAADAIYADPAAVVGSISTIMAGVDSSESWKNEGMELKLWASGAFKALGMPGKKWTPEEEAHVKERMEIADEEFKGYVRARRPVSDEHMQGQTWQAKEVEGLLVDGYAESLAELVAGLLG